MNTERTNRNLSWVLGLTSLPFFMVVLDSLVVITALPRMQQDLHVGLPTLLGVSETEKAAAPRDRVPSDPSLRWLAWSKDVDVDGEDLLDIEAFRLAGCSLAGERGDA